MAWLGAMAGAIGCSSTPVATGKGPYLSELSVSQTLTLVPTFSPDIYDYYVVCAAGTNAVTVSMKAAPGAESVLIQPTPSGVEPQQTHSVEVKENDAIVAAAISGTAKTEYWIRCLPPSFQSIEMIKHPEAGAAPPGYYLVGNNWASGGAPGSAMVLDSNGVPVWYYAQPFATGPFVAITGVFDVDSVVPGTVSFCPWPSTLLLAPFQINDLSSGKIDIVAAPGWALDSHELRALPNGDFLIFTDQTETGIDLTEYPGANETGEPFGVDGSLLPCDILEVDPKGNLVWTWIGTDHFNPTTDSTYPATGEDPTGATVADPFHCNAIDVNPATGNLLVSSRDMDSIFYIERSSGKVLWKMGGSSYTKDNAVYVPVDDPFYRQHDARLQPGWSEKCGGQGQISLFDDETAMSNPARAVVYDVNVGADGDGCGSPSAKVAWQYAGTVPSGFMGSFRISSDGSRVIGWGYEGAEDLVFSEVDSNGNDLLDFYFLDNSSSYRAIKVPLGAFDLDVLRKTAGRSITGVADAGEIAVAEYENAASDAGAPVSDADTGGADGAMP
jgi:hypothetical protein